MSALMDPELERFVTSRLVTSLDALPVPPNGRVCMTGFYMSRWRTHLLEFAHMIQSRASASGVGAMMLVLGMWAGLIAGPESTAPPSVDDERAARAEVEMLIRAAQEKSDKEVNRILGPPTRMRKAPDAAWEMLFPALLVEDSYLREVMLKALQDPGLATAHDLSGLLRNVVRSSRDRNIRLRIVELLKKIGAASLPALTEVGSMDSDPEIRRAAATASGPFREEREALSRRMWTAVNQGRFVEARKAAQELLATFPRDPEATRLHQRLGAVCGVLGNQAGNGDQARALRRSALG